MDLLPVWSCCYSPFLPLSSLLLPPSLSPPSSLPPSLLASLRRLADIDQDNALSEHEFTVAMKLVLVRRRGYDIPSSLPDALRGPPRKGLVVNLPACVYNVTVLLPF